MSRERSNRFIVIVTGQRTDDGNRRNGEDVDFGAWRPVCSVFHETYRATFVQFPAMLLGTTLVGEHSKPWGAGPGLAG